MARVNPIRVLRNVGLQIYPEHFRPKFARIIVTRNCPLRCQMCTFWRKPKPDPSLKLIKHWIKELADFGAEEISIGGGEPFIRKDLPEIVREIKSYGIKCGITTSGWLTDKTPFPFPLADHYEISIDGVKPETHDKIRGLKGSWKQAVRTVKLAKKKASVSQINFVLQADNYLELVDYCKFAKSLGVKVAIIPISPKLAAQPAISKKLGRADTSFLKSILEKAMAVGNVLNTREFFDLYLSKFDCRSCPQKCLAPHDCILIFANGDVYPCGNFYKPVGRLTERKRLKDIYRNYKDVRKAVRQGSYKPCYSCTYPDIIPNRGLLSNIKFFAGEALRSRPSQIKGKPPC